MVWRLRVEGQGSRLAVGESPLPGSETPSSCVFAGPEGRVPASLCKSINPVYEVATQRLCLLTPLHGDSDLNLCMLGGTDIQPITFPSDTTAADGEVAAYLLVTQMMVPDSS